MTAGPKKPRVWLEWNDVAHVTLFNALPIAAIAIALNWRLAVLLVGWACWDLGWHQNQHHRDRSHIHIPLRVVGLVTGAFGIYLLYPLIGRW